MATQIEELRQNARVARAAIDAEMAKYDENNLPSSEETARIEALINARADVDETLAQAESFLRRKTEVNGSQQTAPAILLSGENPKPEPKQKRESIGQRFVTAPNYVDWIQRMAPTGVIPDSMRGINSPVFKFGGLNELRMNSLLTGLSDTSAGAFIVNDRYGPVTEYGRRPLTIRDVITVLQTSSDAVDFARITAETNNAAPVAEATATSGSSGTKPESDLTAEKVTVTVKTIAHWMAATKRALSDAPQLRGLIDNFLEYGLDLELENQIVTGDGTGENFTGIEVTSGIQTQAWDTDILKTLRIARRKVLTVGRRNPNAYLLHPIDWETIDLTQDNEARYYFGGPMAMGTPRLWGLPVVESEAVTQGFGLVADFGVCILWDREDTAISVTDSHADFFVRNLVAILAELRAAFGVLKPNAIVRADLTA